MVYAPELLLTGERIARASGSRMKTAATWLFALPLLAEGVLPGVVKIEAGGVVLLAFASMVIMQRLIPPRAARRVYLTFAVLSLVVMAYATFHQWPAYAGTARSYDLHAALWVMTYGVVAIFAVLFFEEELFARVLWRAATVVLWIGVLTCAASRLTGHLLLVNPANGGLRMVGTLTEPSDWAPVLAVVMLLALRRKSWLYVILALAGLLLADSPTCLLVMAVTLSLYYALAGGWKHRALLLAALVILIPAGILVVQDSHPDAWIVSGDPAKVAVGRLLSGIQNAETGGQVGTNSRLTTTSAVVADVRDSGWMRFGAGPAADATYFPAMYPGPHGSTLTPNALWVSVLFDFGEGGVVILVVLLLVAAWRMRVSPVMTALLLPFLVASLVNSSVPDYSFAALAVMLFGFRLVTPWRRAAAGHWNVRTPKM
ncbi:MAG: hypothetical protein ACRDOU_21690 [Streptosporangiaceae bacterium]